MKRKNIVLLAIAAVVVVSIYYTMSGSRNQTAYREMILQAREQRDRFMHTSKDSPFADNPAAYEGLKYFPPDQRFKVTAQLEPIKEKKTVLLVTNDGKESRYLEYARATFDLDGYHNSLLILEMVDDDQFRGKLFLAFGDKTSAGETYGAGRYLDVEKMPGSNTITLDFNLAYNPFCAYSEKFSCPLPPRENLLDIAVLAGEKVYHP